MRQLQPRHFAPVAAAFAIAFVALAPRSARADDKAECLDAHADAQLLRRAGKLHETRERLLVCARPTCPALVAKDCAQWVGQVNDEQPTIVFAARDAAGQDVARARVLVDGALLVPSLDGRAVEVDPGEHVFRCEFEGGRTLEAHLVVRSGEKRRTVRFELPLDAPPDERERVSTPEPRERAVVPPLAIVLGGVGVLGAISFGAFALSGRAREDELSSSCRPNCSESEIAGVRSRYAVADVSLGVAVVAFGAATWVVLSSPRVPVQAAVSFAPSGASGTLRARF